ncbi:hypothetical protein Bhz55_00111 [Stenotrophomonas phage vB_SmaS_Bhz55]
MSIERMERRFMCIEAGEKEVTATLNEGNSWLITEVCLSDDMNADMAKLMKLAVGETVVDYVGDKFRRVR